MFDDPSNNDVWSTINKTIDSVTGYQKSKLDADVAIANARRPATTSAPSGTPAWQTFNPFPGAFTSYPQADGKANPGGTSAFPSRIGTLAILGIVVLIVIALLRR